MMYYVRMILPSHCLWFQYASVLAEAGRGCTHREGLHRGGRATRLIPQPEIVSTFTYYRVSTALGKQGKWPQKIPVQENTENLKILPKYGETQGILFAQVVNSLILKVKDSSRFAVKISQKKLRLDKSAKSVLCM